jgi:hypothetical protein
MNLKLISFYLKQSRLQYTVNRIIDEWITYHAPILRPFP